MTWRDIKIRYKQTVLGAVWAIIQPVMNPIRALAEKHELVVIEDACEVIGAEYKGRRAGRMGDAAVFAFYPTKQMTTGEGGVIITEKFAVRMAWTGTS